MAKKEITIPYDKNGNMLQWDYDTYYTFGRRNNSIWADVLEYIGYGRGRSAAYFKWQSVFTKRIYYMFISDMNDVLLNTNMVDREVKGRFTYIKRGQNFGIQRIDEFPYTMEKFKLGEID